jgi:hypothetical protein
MITRQSGAGIPVSTDRASVPLTLLTANQPIPAMTEDGDDAHEDRRELEVRRHPGPQQVERPPVSLPRRDELGAAGLDGDHLRPVVALADLAGGHRHIAPLTSPAAAVTVGRPGYARVSR